MFKTISKTVKNKLFFIISAAVAMAAVALVLYCYFLSRPFIGISFQEKNINLTPEYTCDLQDKMLDIADTEGNLIWQSESDIKVQDVLALDLNMDGQNELAILCWKKGKYGPDMPFWEEDDTSEWSQHIYLYELREGQIKAIWMASDIGLVAKEWKALKVGDIEAILIKDTNDAITMWRWDSWGVKMADSTVDFVCVGDNLIQKSIYEQGLLNGKKFDYLYDDFKKEIKNADFAVINQETIFVDKANMYSGYPSFGTPIEVGQAMADAGFNIITLATNHTLDKGRYGVNVTTSFYDEKGITYLGARNESDEYESYKIIQKCGIKIACFNYTYGFNGVDTSDKAKEQDIVDVLPDSESLSKEISDARENADAVIVFIHWGNEYETEPNDEQRTLAQFMCDCGVDVIVGTHPHVIQPWEELTSSEGHKTIVYYSLGNFVSGQNIEGTDIGGIARFSIGYTMDGVGITAHSFEEYQLKY
jgi:hypothetical protein